MILNTRSLPRILKWSSKDLLKIKAQSNMYSLMNYFKTLKGSYFQFFSGSSRKFQKQQHSQIVYLKLTSPCIPCTKSKQRHHKIKENFRPIFFMNTDEQRYSTKCQQIESKNSSSRLDTMTK